VRQLRYLYPEVFVNPLKYLLLSAQDLSRLRETRERTWLVGMACLVVGLTTTVTVPLAWRLFAWIGQWAGVAGWVWQAGFAFFSIVPALVAGIFLLARGTYLAEHDG